MADPARLPADPDGAHPAPAGDLPHRPVLVPEPTTAELVEEAVGRWRAGLVRLAGGSSLADVSLLGDAVVDLTAAHPSGIAQLFAGRRRACPTSSARAARCPPRAVAPAPWSRRAPTTPSATASRPPTSPSVSRRGPRRTPPRPCARTTSPRSRASPVAPPRPSRSAPTDRRSPPAARTTSPTPTPAPRSTRRAPAPCAHPCCCRPLTVTPRGDGETDYELTLEPTAEINPLLARTLRAHGALLDPVTLARSTFTGAGFDPADATTRIAALGRAVLGDFELTHRVLAGAFVHPGQALVDDLDEHGTSIGEHEIVAALAGDADAAEAIHRELPAPRVGDADPELERGVGDLDPSQRYVVDALATGSHLFVDAPAAPTSPGPSRPSSPRPRRAVARCSTSPATGAPRTSSSPGSRASGSAASCSTSRRSPPGARA
ncbi:hypothetical protein [Cellulosimicrobium sp. CUA-896]|uniref:hypothetical protein n=1 Tax=Cellulosimicrobium sp. CUA-896 TaxID=1517881 RepID=UPI002100B102|nr:hypothetical protein [Cellulosimicrobium sp. CUA-896]